MKLHILYSNSIKKINIIIEFHNKLLLILIFTNIYSTY